VEGEYCCPRGHGDQEGAGETWGKEKSEGEVGGQDGEREHVWVGVA